MALTSLSGLTGKLKAELWCEWLLVLLTGVAAAAMSFSINAGIEAMDKLRYTAALNYIHPGGGLVLPWLVFNAISCALSAVASLGVAYLAPLAAGSGIPHIKAYCNGIEIPGLLTVKTLLVKATGAMFSIGSGLIAGKEGPFIQCGACIAAILLQWSQNLAARTQYDPWDWTNTLPRTENLSNRQEQQQHAQHVSQPLSKDSTVVEVQPDDRMGVHDDDWLRMQQQRELQRLRHDQVAMGAGAGIAAAFVAPLAGAAYTIEEASSHYSGSLLSQAFLAGGVVVFFIWLFTKSTQLSAAQLGRVMYDSPLALAFRGNDGTDVRFWWYVWEVPIFLVMGALGGLLMALWTYLNTLHQWLRKKVLTKPLAKVADVAMCCLITNTIRLLVAHASPCAEVPAAAELHLLQQQVTSWQFFTPPVGPYPQLWCPEGHYSIYGQLFMLPLEVSVRSLFTIQPPHNNTLTLNKASESQTLITPSSYQQKPSQADVYRMEVLAAYFAFVWLMLLLSYGIAAPTGIFIPCLAAGAAAGRLLGQIVQMGLLHGGIVLPVCMPGWSVLGAAAVLAGCTRLTLANILIVLESSGAVPMVVPMVLLMIPAKYLADALFIGIYDWQIEDAGYPFLPAVDQLTNRERALLLSTKVTAVLPETCARSVRQHGNDSTEHKTEEGGDSCLDSSYLRQQQPQQQQQHGPAAAGRGQQQQQHQQQQMFVTADERQQQHTLQEQEVHPSSASATPAEDCIAAVTSSEHVHQQVQDVRQHDALAIQQHTLAPCSNQHSSSSVASTQLSHESDTSECVSEFTNNRNSNGVC